MARVKTVREQHKHQLLEVELLDYAFLAPETAHEDLARAIEKAQLTIVDPAYSTLVPEAWKYRMNGPDQ